MEYYVWKPPNLWPLAGVASIDSRFVMQRERPDPARHLENWALPLSPEAKDRIRVLLIDAWAQLPPPAPLSSNHDRVCTFARAAYDAIAGELLIGGALDGRIDDVTGLVRAAAVAGGVVEKREVTRFNMNTIMRGQAEPLADYELKLFESLVAPRAAYWASKVLAQLSHALRSPIRAPARSKNGNDEKIRKLVREMR